ncbi:MAG TPA: 16S rRNA (guanine(966)-N(2))-methyltransferase RsmD [Rhabdochlamydiaceae bacterium]|jgi:16S rRNA (guanine(966)-N(2))-methyltransferase RsmD
MKIIGGKYRNRLLKAPKGVKTRPTLAILRKAVFDMLQPVIVDAHFLDLFAGSGLMGLEALSRGAAKATFIDSDRAAVRCIEENVKLLSLKQQANIYCCDALSALQISAKKHIAFDIIYIDPPYQLSQTTPILKEILLFLETHPLLNPGGIVMVEESSPATLPIPELPLTALRYDNTRKFSDSLLHKYQFVAGEAP